MIEMSEVPCISPLRLDVLAESFKDGDCQASSLVFTDVITSSSSSEEATESRFPGIDDTSAEGDESPLKDKMATS